MLSNLIQYHIDAESALLRYSNVVDDMMTEDFGPAEKKYMELHHTILKIGNAIDQLGEILTWEEE